jgi:hypothetical protein
MANKTTGFQKVIGFSPQNFVLKLFKSSLDSYPHCEHAPQCLKSTARTCVQNLLRMQ